MWLLACVLSLCVGAWALHESDVGVVDWHKEFIGVPLSGSISTSPSFHRAENRSFIVAATSSNVLAALEPEDGSILWRYIFTPEDRIAGYFKNESVIATLSGPGGSTLRTINATNGQLLYEKRIHPPETGAISEPVYIGKDVVFSHDAADLYVLSNGYTVSAIDGNTGNFKWRWTASDKGSKIIHTKLVLTTDTIYTIGVAKTAAASHTLHVTTLNASTGEVIHSANIGANIIDPWKESVTVLNPSLQLPVAVWLEKGTLRYVPLTPTLNGKPKSARGSGFIRIIDVGVGRRGQVVAVRQDGLGVLYQLEGEQTSATVVWEYEDAPSAKKNSESFYSAAFDENGYAYVGRIFWSHSIQRGSTDVFAAHIAMGQSTGAVFPYNIKKFGVIQNVALDSGNPYEWTVKSRLLLVTNTGVLQFWDADEVKWTREEALANISAAEVVEIPQSVTSETNRGNGELENFVTRIRRQISDAKDFPRYVINFVNRFTGGSLPISSIPTSNDPTTGLSRDQFGFRQVIVAATKLGKIYGIDSSNGEIIWSRVLSHGWAESVGAQVIPVKIYTIKTVSDGGNPEVVLVTQRRADNGLVDTVIFHVDAMTGQDVAGRSKDDLKIEGQDIISGSLVDSFFLNNDQKVVVLLDEFLQVYLYPDTAKTQSTFQDLIPKLSFPLRTKGEQTTRVVGHQISLSDNPTFRPVAHPTWSFNFQPSESIQALIAPASRGPIASFGKVLGNRTTLYKYLNPRLFTVLTSIPEKAKCGLYVVDSMKGTILYRVEVNATSSARGCEMKAVLVENWLVFHYYQSEIGEGGAKGYRMVSVEFYEGQGVDEKTKSIELSAFHNETLNFHTWEQAYILPNGITTMASTTTRFGISNKDLIVATKDHKVQQLPRVLLNPRRPKRKPTSEEQEEFLIEYDPVLPHDPKRVLSHNYKVTNVQNILTSPSLLESTTLIYAYGLDMFMTRLAPSGTFDVLSETFNKMQLLFTVLGLFVAIFVTRPMVKRKQLREKWYR